MLALPGYRKLYFDIDFRLLQEIASGGFGSVYMAESLSPVRLPEHTFVVKLVDEKKMMKEHVREAFFQEVAIMNMLNGKGFFVEFMGYCDSPYAIVMKYYTVTLGNYVRTQALSKSLIMIFAHNISSALSVLHSYGIVHCDLKSDNVLIDIDTTGHLSCVLGDFGISKLLSNQLLQVSAFQPSTIQGVSKKYAAPELYSRKRSFMIIPEVEKARDTYAYALTIYEMLTRQRPWK
jgi:serine/threonine protein kinase